MAISDEGFWTTDNATDGSQHRSGRHCSAACQLPMPLAPLHDLLLTRAPRNSRAARTWACPKPRRSHVLKALDIHAYRHHVRGYAQCHQKAQPEPHVAPD